MPGDTCRESNGVAGSVAATKVLCGIPGISTGPCSISGTSTPSTGSGESSFGASSASSCESSSDDSGSIFSFAPSAWQTRPAQEDPHVQQTSRRHRSRLRLPAPPPAMTDVAVLPARLARAAAATAAAAVARSCRCASSASTRSVTRRRRRGLGGCLCSNQSKSPSSAHEPQARPLHLGSDITSEHLTRPSLLGPKIPNELLDSCVWSEPPTLRCQLEPCRTVDRPGQDCQTRSSLPKRSKEDLCDVVIQILPESNQSQNYCPGRRLCQPEEDEQHNADAHARRDVKGHENCKMNECAAGRGLDIPIKHEGMQSRQYLSTTRHAQHASNTVVMECPEGHLGQSAAAEGKTQPSEPACRNLGEPLQSLRPRSRAPPPPLPQAKGRGKGKGAPPQNPSCLGRSHSLPHWTGPRPPEDWKADRVVNWQPIRQFGRWEGSIWQQVHSNMSANEGVQLPEDVLCHAFGRRGQPKSRTRQASLSTRCRALPPKQALNADLLHAQLLRSGISGPSQLSWLLPSGGDLHRSREAELHNCEADEEEIPESVLEAVHGLLVIVLAVPGLNRDELRAGKAPAEVFLADLLGICSCSPEELQPQVDMIFKIVRFQDRASTLKRQLEEGLNCIHQILTSEAVPDLLEGVLLLGNYVNAASKCLGGVVGVTLDSIAKLAHTRCIQDDPASTVGGQNALHLLVRQLEARNRPTFAEELAADLEGCLRARELDPKEAGSELQSLKGLTARVRDVLAKGKDCNAESPALQPTRLLSFLNKADPEMDCLQQLLNKLHESTAALRIFFAEPDSACLQEMLRNLAELHKVLPRARPLKVPFPSRPRPCHLRHVTSSGEERTAMPGMVSSFGQSRSLPQQGDEPQGEILPLQCCQGPSSACSSSSCCSADPAGGPKEIAGVSKLDPDEEACQKERATEKYVDRKEQSTVGKEADVSQAATWSKTIIDEHGQRLQIRQDLKEHSTVRGSVQTDKDVVTQPQPPRPVRQVVTQPLPPPPMRRQGKGVAQRDTVARAEAISPSQWTPKPLPTPPGHAPSPSTA